GRRRRGCGSRGRTRHRGLLSAVGDLPDDLGLWRVRSGHRRRCGRLVALGGRQREHRARRRLLRRRSFGRGRQRASAAPRGLRLTGAGRVRRAVGRGRALVSAVGRRARRGRCGEGGRECVLVTGGAPGAPSGGGGDALGRDGPAEAGAGGRGARRVLGGRDDGALGDSGAVTGRGDHGARARVLGRTAATAAGAAGDGALAGGLRRQLGGFGGRRPPPAPAGGRRGLGGGLRGGTVGSGRRGVRVVGALDLALQEGVHGRPSRPPPPAGGPLGRRVVAGVLGVPGRGGPGEFHLGGRYGPRAAA